MEFVKDLPDTMVLVKLTADEWLYLQRAPQPITLEPTSVAAPVILTEQPIDLPEILTPAYQRRKKIEVAEIANE